MPRLGAVATFTLLALVYQLFAERSVAQASGLPQGHPRAVHSSGTQPTNQGGGHRFPRTLQRVYDGTWEVAPSAGVPFAKVPRSPDVRMVDPSFPGLSTNLSSSASVARPSVPINHDLAFTRRSGFALLSAENIESPLGEGVDIVFGELLLRDGKYRSSLDVQLRLIGVYEWENGLIFVVGDLLFEDSGSALQRLYNELSKTYLDVVRTKPKPSGLNVTEDVFVAKLMSPFEKHRKQFRSADSTHTGVAAQCPFLAVFSIAAGSYNDRPPRQFSSTSGFRIEPDPGEQIVPGPAFGSIYTIRTMLHDSRAEDASGSAGSFGTNIKSSSSEEDSFTSQDELVSMHGVFVSEACDTTVTVKLSTLDREALFGKAITYTLLVTVVVLAQGVLLIRQMKMTSTQAETRRVSLITVGLQAIADSNLCLGHLSMGMAIQNLFIAFATAALFKFILFILLLRWMFWIMKARRSSESSEVWREMLLLWLRLFGSLVFGVFLLYQMQNHLWFFLFALYSFWLPQIILNVMEGNRGPLLPIYILGTSVTRLTIPLYFWGYSGNFLSVQPQPGSFAALVSWLLFQACILLSQNKFGPGWFIPKEFLPQNHDDYRPVT